MKLKFPDNFEELTGPTIERLVFDDLFRRYRLPVRSFPSEYTRDDWKRLAYALAFAYEPAFKTTGIPRVGAPKKWPRARLLALDDCVQAIKRRHGVGTNKAAVNILTTRYSEHWGPEEGYTLPRWQVYLTKRVTDAKNEARKPRLGLLFKENPKMFD